MDKKNELIKKLYESFETGYDFEIFLKEFLEDLKFSDIEVTKRSNDGGIDLVSYKSTIEDLNKKEEKYIIQAKRYKENISPKTIREFKGTGRFEKRIFITTSDFSKEARKEAEDDTSRNVILISGEDIIEYYINIKSDKILDWEPEISKEKIQALIKKNKNTNIQSSNTSNNKEKIQKIITKNDIRARILPIPYDIFEKIKDASEYIVVIDSNEKLLKINTDRKYFGGITDFYRNHGYLDYNGIENKKSYWYYDEKEKRIYVELI